MPILSLKINALIATGLLCGAALFLLAPSPALAQACGDPGTGSCLEGNGSTHCISQDCCDTICASDSFCCDTEWDSLCADDALANCSAAIDSVMPNMGSAGTTITIVGELLSGPEMSTDVTVGGNPCTGTTIVDDNEVTCDAPMGSGTVDVTVVNNQTDFVNNSATLTGGFSYGGVGEATAVPTLGQWSIIILALALLGFGLISRRL